MARIKEKGLYSLPFLYKNRQEYEEAIKHISSFIAEDKDLQELDNDVLFKIDEIALKLSLSTRMIIEDKNSGVLSDKDKEQEYIKLMIFNEKNRDDLLKNIPVFVEEKDKILAIFTPYLFRRSFGGDYTNRNFLMANYISDALKNYEKNNRKILENLFKNNEKLTVIVVRKSLKFSTKMICDNDNIETGRIINEVFRYIGKADNARKMDFAVKYLQCQKEEECGTYFYVQATDDYEKSPKKALDIQPQVNYR